MKHAWKILAAVVALALGYVIFNLQAGSTEPVPPGAEVLRDRMPLADDGYPDFGRAIDDAHRGELRSEDNAALPLIELFGAKVLDEEDAESRLALCRALGLERAPEGTARWADPFIWSEARAQGKVEDPEAAAIAFCDGLAECGKSGWNAADAPERVAYLEDHRQALDGLVKAVARPRLWLPSYESPTGGTLSTTGFEYFTIRGAPDALAARARLSLGAGALEAAVTDTEALWRLEGLMIQLPGGFPRCLAQPIAESAAAVTAALLGCEDLAPSQVDRLEAALVRDAASPNLVTVIDLVDRSLLLDMVLRLTGARSLLNEAAALGLRRDALDGELTLALVQEIFDEAAAGARRRPLAEAAAAIKEVRDRTLGKAKEQAAEIETLWGRVKLWFMLPGPRRELASRYLANSLSGMTLGGTAHLISLEAVRVADRRLSRLAIAALRHRRQEGRWPEDLKSLGEGEVLFDPFTGRSFLMERDGDRLRLQQPPGGDPEIPLRKIEIG